jgi:hypothetical protein
MVIRHCIFRNVTDSTFYTFVDLVRFSGRLEGNLFVNLSLRSSVIGAEVDCHHETVVVDNDFHNCRRIINQGAPAPLLHIYCESSASQAYVVERNLMYACTTSGYSKGIRAEDKGIFLENRMYDLVGAFNSFDPAVFGQYADSMIFRENLFYHNGLAMNVEQSEIVDARWNYWGDATGPHHESENPEGLGDSILGAVIVDPWYPDTSFLDLSDVHAPLPDHFELDAYPNPFNATVTLRLIPPEAMIVRVELFDVLGRRVQELWNGPLAFEKRIPFDGSYLSSGIYFARVWQPIGNRPLALTKLVLMK